MKKANVFFSLSVIKLFIGECKQDESEPPVTYPDYERLQVGNYWIYQRFVIDSLGNATPTDVFDSCYVEKDTLIHGNNFAKITKPWPWGTTSQKKVNEYLRDSLHYLVDPSGMVWFSSVDYSTVFYSYTSIIPTIGDTVYTVNVKMDDKDLLISTPAGEFITCNYKASYKLYPPFIIVSNPRFTHKRYAKDIGLIVETLPFFASIPTTTERRLVRYFLNPSD
jgi:hypothetical protein